MRKIKFRAWHIDDRRMLQVDAIALADNVFEWGPGITDQHNDFYALKDVVLMQFTGLLDKDGKEIYEGDVVRWSDNFEKRVFCKRVFCYESAVHWGQGGWDILGAEVQGSRIVELLGEVIKDEQANVEIIGNIHENPELLEAK